MAIIATENARFSNVVKQELWPELGYTREVVTVREGAAKSYVPGTVLGKVTSGTATPAAKAGNAANTGTIASATASAGAKDGVYTITITAAATNAGTFSVVDPDGIALPSGTVAVAYASGGLAFTVTDGTQDFIVGEGFTITVSEGFGEYKVAVETATDGSKVAAAIVAGEYTVAANTDTKVLTLIKGPAIVSKSGLVLDSTYDNAFKKNAVYASLEALGIAVNDAI